MKIIAKICALALALATLAGVAACSPYTTTIDKNRTQLYVGLYNGGWGREWLDAAKAQFEEKYPEYQIVITPRKDEYEYATLKNNIQTDFNDMYITACSYFNYIADNQILDITDAVRQDMADLGEPGQSVESKMLESYAEYYGTDGRYYAVPFGSSVWGLNYDVDLFEEESFYISSSDGTGSNIVWTNGKDGSPAKSAGRDGETGTYDDGCPVTFAEFQALLRRMRQANITPFLWSEQLGYIKFILLSLWADAEGEDNFELLKTLTGTFTDYNGNQVTLKPSEGYKVGLMKGKKYALEFAQEIVSTTANYSDVSGQLDFMGAQANYIESKYAATEGVTQTKRIAFFIDGGHWYNESKAYIEECNDQFYPEYSNGRRFSVMPFPTFDSERGTQATYLESSHQFSMFVNAQTEKADIAKLFIRFLCTDEMLKTTTVLSGLHRNYKYTLSAEERASMPYYYDQLYQLQSSDKVDIVNLRMGRGFYTRNESMEALDWVFTGSFVGTDGLTRSLQNPVDDFKNYAARAGLTVEKYLEGTLETYKSTFQQEA